MKIKNMFLMGICERMGLYYSLLVIRVNQLVERTAKTMALCHSRCGMMERAIPDQRRSAEHGSKFCSLSLTMMMSPD